MARRPDLVRRHRETREASRGRLLTAARELVEDRPWSEISIGDVSGRAGLTRTAFYKHFSDPRSLLLALFDEVGEEILAAGESWLSGAGRDQDGPAMLGQAVTHLAGIFREHGRLLQAVADEAARDPEMAVIYERFGTEIAEAAGSRMARDGAVADPTEVATALVWMSERYLRVRFGRHPLGDVDRVAATLREMWVGVAYGARATRP